MKYELAKRGRNIPVATLVTQIVVDKNDSGFKNPTKSIRPFYCEEEAKKLLAERAA